MPLKFEWDEDKERINRQKHGISFKTAALVFEDEDRYITIGMAGEVLFVVYTERKETIRIISARLATARERSLYYGYGKI